MPELGVPVDHLHCKPVQSDTVQVPEAALHGNP